MIALGEGLMYMTDGGDDPAVLDPDRVFMFVISSVTQDFGHGQVMKMSVQYDDAAESCESGTFPVDRKQDLEDWLRSHGFGKVEEYPDSKFLDPFDVWINMSKILILGDSIWISKEGAFSPYVGPFADKVMEQLGDEWLRWKKEKLDIEKKEEEDEIDEILGSL